jgi:hypothetical protein
MTKIRVFHHDNDYVQFEYKSKAIPRKGDWISDPRDAVWPEPMKVKSIHHCVHHPGRNEHIVELAFIDVTVTRHYDSARADYWNRNV